MLGAITEWTKDVILKGSYFGLGFLVALESIFPPIPSEIILPLAGFLTGRGELNFFGAVAAATVGSVVGAMALYEIGRRLGEDRIKRFIEHRGKWVMLSETDVDRAANWFSKHGRVAVLLGRCVPGVRSFISIPAGVQRMPILQFLIYTTMGSLVWNAALVGLGYAVGNQWERVSQYTSWFEYVVWAALLFFIGKRLYCKFRPSSKDESTSGT